MYNFPFVKFDAYNVGKKKLNFDPHLIFPNILRRHEIFYDKVNKDILKNNMKERAIADFIAGMTDRYAINLHKKIR